MKKRYLISGGAGFLGANLTKRIIAEGGEVVVLDNLQTGNKRNLAQFSNDKNFKFIKQDVCKPIQLSGKFHYVLNLACPASPPKYYADPVHTLETCSVGTKNMLDFALKNKARFFHTSTSEVYGDPLEHPQSESYAGNVMSYCKRSCYDEGKRYAEALIFQYRNEKKLNTGLIRIFNTYGPLMDPDDGRVVSNFIKQALSGTDITIQGTGKQTRSFCYVDDQMDAQMKFIHSDLEGPLNIGNPDEFTMLELADKVIKHTKPCQPAGRSESKIIHVTAAISDPKQRKPNIKLAKKLLDWQPKINLDQGIEKTIDWFKSIGY